MSTGIGDTPPIVKKLGPQTETVLFGRNQRTDWTKRRDDELANLGSEPEPETAGVLASEGPKE